mgnify:CR=1 FL=1
MRAITACTALILSLAAPGASAKVLTYAIDVQSDFGSFTDCVHLDTRAASPLTIDGYGPGLVSAWNQLGTDRSGFVAVSGPAADYSIAFAGELRQGRTVLVGNAVTHEGLRFHLSGIQTETCTPTLQRSARWR